VPRCTSTGTPVFLRTKLTLLLVQARQHVIDRSPVRVDNARMSKTQLKSEICAGPNGEKLTVSWMPNNRVRLTFRNCGKAAVTKVFPAKLTNIEINYHLP
jgi:hypothetical protein